jgi:hypothetical protein
MNALQDIPAFVYTALWPAMLEGRLKFKDPNEIFTILVDFSDYPPGAFVEIKNGSFTVHVLELNTQKCADIEIRGKFSEIIEVTGAFGKIIPLLLTRKLRIRGIFRAIRLFKLMSLPEVNKK